MNTLTLTALTDAVRALKLVKALHNQPESANVPKSPYERNNSDATTFNVDLDPKAYEQVVNAIALGEQALAFRLSESADRLGRRIW